MKSLRKEVLFPELYLETPLFKFRLELEVKGTATVIKTPPTMTRTQLGSALDIACPKGIPKKAPPVNPKRVVDIDSIKHKDAREIGAEWMCYQALKQLQLKEKLTALAWEEEDIQLALTQIVDSAEARLFNLRKRLNERYEDISGMELYQRQSKLAI